MPLSPSVKKNISALIYCTQNGFLTCFLVRNTRKFFSQISTLGTWLEALEINLTVFQGS